MCLSIANTIHTNSRPENGSINFLGCTIGILKRSRDPGAREVRTLLWFWPPTAPESVVTVAHSALSFGIFYFNDDEDKGNSATEALTLHSLCASRMWLSRESLCINSSIYIITT
jgi:hypothetical protein